MDNRSAFTVNDYYENVRRVIPFYDVIHDQIVSLIKTCFGERPVSLLDTGCGTGSLELKLCKNLNLSELVLCDPSEKMLASAKERLQGIPCEFFCRGSEQLEFRNSFDVVTAVQSHHYFDRAAREKAVSNCFGALKSGGMFICFENTAPFSEVGKRLMLSRLESFELLSGRTHEEVKAHSARYGTEFFPLSIKEHLELLKKTGFSVYELFWHSYMQSGFYGIKP